MSKIKEKKLNSIKSEMEEIKKFIVSNNELDSSEQKQTDYFNNNDEDTVTLTEVVNKEDKFKDNNKVFIIEPVSINKLFMPLLAKSVKMKLKNSLSLNFLSTFIFFTNLFSFK